MWPKERIRAPHRPGSRLVMAKKSLLHTETFRHWHDFTGESLGEGVGDGQAAQGGAGSPLLRSSSEWLPDLGNPSPRLRLLPGYPRAHRVQGAYASC